jgi:hypothetical protein
VGRERPLLLQIAIDRAESLGVIAQMRRVADIIEIGTPLLKRFGIGAIATARELCPDTRVLADTKTVDAGDFEAEMVLGAGARLMTVLSSTSPATHAAVGKAAARFGAFVVVGTITESGKPELLPAGAIFRRPSRMSAFILRPICGSPETVQLRISTPFWICGVEASALRLPADWNQRPSTLCSRSSRRL